MAKIKIETNIDVLLKQLSRAGIGIQEAGADAINMGASKIASTYKKRLKSEKRLRNEDFTLKGVAILRAHAKHSDKKTYRAMGDINAIVGIRQLRNGDHYLTTMEIGGKKTGRRQAGNKVPIPLTTSRGGNIMSPVIQQYRITKKINQYQGVLKHATSARQQYAILYSLARAGKIKNGMYQSDDAVYSVTPSQVVMIRRVKESVTVKPAPLFEGATATITQSQLDRFFLISANKKIRALG